LPFALIINYLFYLQEEQEVELQEEHPEDDALSTPLIAKRENFF